MILERIFSKTLFKVKTYQINIKILCPEEKAIIYP
jgi:hypothetical protein